MLLDLLQQSSHGVVREVVLESEVLDHQLRIFSLVDLEDLSAVSIKLDAQSAERLESGPSGGSGWQGSGGQVVSQSTHVSELIADLSALLFGQRESLSVDQVLDHGNLGAQVLFGNVGLVVNDLVKILGQEIVI